MSHYVNVTRDGTQWLGEVPSLAGAHSYAGNLVALDERMREVIALVEDLPEGAEAGLALAWDYSAVGADVVAAARVGEEHLRLEAERRADTERVRAEINRLVAQKYSTRDIAGLLHVTPGYVSPVTTAA